MLHRLFYKFVVFPLCILPATAGVMGGGGVLCAVFAATEEDMTVELLITSPIAIGLSVLVMWFFSWLLRKIIRDRVIMTHQLPFYRSMLWISYATGFALTVIFPFLNLK